MIFTHVNFPECSRVGPLTVGCSPLLQFSSQVPRWEKTRLSWLDVQKGMGYENTFLQQTQIWFARIYAT